MARLSDDQKQLLGFLPDDGTAVGGHTLFAQLQEAGWRTKEIERTMDQLRELGEIIVGRGGNGGSIRHVRKDRRALLDAISEFSLEGTVCTRQSLQQYMRWNPDYLEQVLEFLCEADKIHIGPGGGGGVITLAEEDALEDDEVEDRTSVLDDPAEDERRLLGLIPASGAVSNSRLRSELEHRHGWAEERYWETRNRLRQKGLIEVGRGRGGSVRRVSIDAVVSTPVPATEPEPVVPEERLDEDAVWQRLPERGEMLDLGVLQKQLGWLPDRFFSALERLSTSHRIHWSNSKVKRLLLEAAAPAPTAPSTPPAAPATDRFGALYGFFLSRFDSGSLQRFLDLHLCAPTVTQGIAWNGDYADIAYRTVTALRRENYIDDELFDKLRAYFPKLHPHIEGLSQMWLDAPGD